MRVLYDYAMSFVGVPYIYGADHPAHGMDCSGFVQEILASTGLDPKGDQTAQALFDWFSTAGRGSINSWGLGALAFFGKSASQISHVGFCLDEYRMVEAGGGDSYTTNIDEAVKRKAFVRVRLIKNRTDLVAVIKPYYSTVGNF